MHNSVDLWKQRLCYPSRYADQVCCSKENAQLCQPFPRVLTSAMEGELNSLLRDELLPLTLLGLQHKQTVESMLFNLLNDSIQILAPSLGETLLLANVVRSQFEWSNEAWGENCKAGIGVVTSVLCPGCSVLLKVQWLHSKLPANIMTGQRFKRFGLVILKLS